MSLTQKISFLLIIKLILLFILWKVCFSHPLEKTIRSQGIASHIYRSGETS